MTVLLGWGAAFLVGAAISIASYFLIGVEDSSLRRWWDRYVEGLDADARFLRLDRGGREIARVHAAVLLAIFVGAIVFRAGWLLFMLPVAAVVPAYRLRRARESRVFEIEGQIDSWLLILSNALRASPSLGDSLASSASLARGPLAEELDLMLKETRLGIPIDQALSEMGRRVGSRILTGAIANLMIARQTGGDLSRTLEASAAALREMQRLEGVVRTRTAEGKSQAYVMGVMPFALVGMIHLLDDQFLVPLVTHPIGWGVLALAVLLWLGAIALTKKILAVDI